MCSCQFIDAADPREVVDDVADVECGSKILEKKSEVCQNERTLLRTFVNLFLQESLVLAAP